MTLMNLVEFLKWKREQLGISARKAAEDIGISHTELHRIENGKRKKIEPEVLKPLLALYGIHSYTQVAFKDDVGTHRIYDLIYAYETKDKPPKKVSIFSPFTDNLSPKEKRYQKFLNIISEYFDDWEWSLPSLLPLTPSHFDMTMYNNKGDIWCFYVVDARKDSRLLVKEIYYHLLTTSYKASKVSVITDKPVIFNAFKNRMASHFSFVFSIILVDYKKNTIVDEYSSTELPSPPDDNII